MHLAQSLIVCWYILQNADNNWWTINPVANGVHEPSWLRDREEGCLYFCTPGSTILDFTLYLHTMGNSQITRPFHHETKGRQIPKILLYNALQSCQFTARLSVYRQVLTLNFVQLYHMFTVHWSTKRESRVTSYLNMDISKRSVNLATFIASFLVVLITNTPWISSDCIELRNNARLSRPPYCSSYWTSWRTTAKIVTWW